MGIMVSDSRDAEGRNSGGEDGAFNPGSALDLPASAQRRETTTSVRGAGGGLIKRSPFLRAEGIEWGVAILPRFLTPQEDAPDQESWGWGAQCLSQSRRGALSGRGAPA